MIAIRDIEEAIRYSYRHNPMYGEDLIKQLRDAFGIKNRLDAKLQDLSYMEGDEPVMQILREIQSEKSVKQ